jgi:hypothetical protein
MRCKSLSDAQKQAEANAKASGHAWVIIRDTNGQYHAESSKVTSPSLDIVVQTYQP